MGLRRRQCLGHEKRSEGWRGNGRTELSRGEVVGYLFDGLDSPIPRQTYPVSDYIFTEGRTYVSWKKHILKFPPTKNLRAILAVERSCLFWKKWEDKAVFWLKDSKARIFDR